MTDLEALWTLFLILQSLIGGAMTLGKNTWGRFRWAGMTKPSFYLAGTAVVLSVGLGWSTASR